jgi:predicted dehydrogenase
MRPIDRRRFFHDSAALAAGLSLASAATTDAQAEDVPSGKKAGPNEVIRIAVIGARGVRPNGIRSSGRGMEHLDQWTKLQNDVRVTTVCDVDKNVIGPAMKLVAKTNGAEPKYVQDLRRVFDDKEIDAVSIATPNHWHALAAIWAIQAGKDVYVEKPVSANVSEGRRIVEAARKYGKICQAGTQCRSNSGVQEAIAYLRSGKLGTVYLARGLCFKPRGSIGHKDNSSVPDGLDYDIWTGPAEMKPYNENRLHYNWHWFWNTGAGDLGNQGIHQMDIARWGLGKTEFPKAVQAAGGRFGYKDDGETPNTLLTAFEFDDCMLEFEVRGLPTNDEAKAKVGVVFYGTEGILSIPSYTEWQTYLGPKCDQKGPGGSGGGDQFHFANFVKAVKARDPKLLNADIEEGHVSSAYCHLGNIAYRLGRKLHINPSSESFVSDSEADAMLTRDYRAPYIVPARV